MKSTLLFMVIATLLHFVCSEDFATIKREFKKIREECIQENPVSQASISKLAKKQLVEDNLLKKYFYCMARKRRFVDAKGKYDLPRVQHIYAKFIGNHDSDKVIQQCAKNPIIGDAATSYWKIIRCFQLRVNDNDFGKMIKYLWLP